MSEDGERLEPGGQLHTLLDTLDVATAGERELADALTDYDRVIAQATARQHQLIAELDRRRERTEKDWIREEVALALGVMPATAKDRLATSRVLYGQLPDTWAALARGRITAFQAKLLANAIDRLAPETADTVVAKIEAYVLRAAGCSYSAWKTRITQALHKYAPVDVAQARRAAQRDRTCWHTPGENETGTLVVHGPLDATMIAWSMIDDHAHTLAGEGRSLEQRRFDAFASLFLGSRAWEKVQPVIEVTVPLSTLHGGDDPAELVGYGTINPETARRLAYLPNARWRRLTYHTTTGYLIACGERTYTPGELTGLLTTPVEPPPPAEPRWRPSPRLRGHVKARDRYCVFPRCRRKARRCPVDHTIKYFHGGPTCPCNLHPLCVRHHLMKDDPTSGWTLTNHSNGTWTWTAPTASATPADPTTTAAPEHPAAPGRTDNRADTDIRGVYVAPTSSFWSLVKPPMQVEGPGERFSRKVERFCEVALKANPNLLEVLHSPLVVTLTSLGEELVERWRLALHVELDEALRHTPPPAVPDVERVDDWLRSLRARNVDAVQVRS